MENKNSYTHSEVQGMLESYKNFRDALKNYLEINKINNTKRNEEWRKVRKYLEICTWKIPKDIVKKFNLESDSEFWR